MGNRSFVTSLPPTFGITDPAAKAFADALTNLLDTRSGVTDPDSPERFVTAREAVGLAARTFVSSLGQGVVGGADGNTGAVTVPTAAEINGALDLLTESIRKSITYQLLEQTIRPIDLSRVRDRIDEIRLEAQKAVEDARIDLTALTTAFNNEKAAAAAAMAALQLEVDTEVARLDDGITQLNTLTSSSTSANARQVAALKVTTDASTAAIVAINDVSTTSTSANASQLAAVKAQSATSAAAITQLNTVNATSTSANVQALLGLSAQVNHATTGLPAAQSAIGQINNVSATSTSANAQALFTLRASVNDPATGLARAHGDIAQINKVDATSTSVLVQNYLSLVGQVNHASTGLPAAQAAIFQLNKIDNTSTSANVQALLSMSATINNPATGLAASHSRIDQVNNLTNTSTSAAALKIQEVVAQVNHASTGLPAAVGRINAIETISAGSSSVIARRVFDIDAAVYNASTGLARAHSRITEVASAAADENSATAESLSLLEASVNHPSTGLPAAHTAIGGLATATNAAISSEASVRATTDSAIAQSIETIWTSVGGSGAAVTDGVFVDTGNVAAIATKFTQLQAAVTDPNTGLINATSLKQDLTTYANNATGALTATYSLRLQTQTGGGATVTATNNSATAAGGTTLTLASATGVVAGMRVIGAGVPLGCGVFSVVSNTVTLTTPLLEAASTGATAVTGTATTASGVTNARGSNRLTLTTANANIRMGMQVTGTGIASGTTVASVNSAVIFLSDALTAAASGSYSFQTTYTFTANRPLVGGFAASATNGVGGSGPSIDFGFRGDRFYIAGTSDTPDAATQIAAGSSVPFMVLTSTQTVNGKSYPPGVYMKKAVIGAATIGSAEIDDLAVNTINIAGNAVTQPVTATQASDVTVSTWAAATGDANTWYDIVSVGLPFGSTAGCRAIIGFTLKCTIGGGGSWAIRWRVIDVASGDTLGTGEQGVGNNEVGDQTVTATVFEDSATGTRTYKLQVALYGDIGASRTVYGSTIFGLGAKK